MRSPFAPITFGALAAALTAPLHAQDVQPVWSSVYDGPASQDDYPVQLALDAQGNVTVAGRSYNASVGFPPAPPTQDALVARYDADGVEQWALRYDRYGGDDQFQDVAIEPVSGDAILVGYSSGYVASTYVTDLIVQRVAPDGTILWTTTHDGIGAGADFGRSVLLDAAGNIYVGASCYGGAATGQDMALLEFDGGGQLVFETYVDGSGHAADSGTFLAFDPSGNIALAGQLASSPTNSDLGAALISPAGAILWQRERGGSSIGPDFGLAVACDAAGAVYVAGWSTNADMDPTLVKWDAAGNPQWAIDYADPAAGSGQFRDVEVDAGGRVLVFGHSPGVGTGLDLVVQAWEASGAPLWERRHDGAAGKDDTARALVVDGAGELVVAGWSYGPSGTSADADTVVLRYDAAGSLRWAHHGVHPGAEDRAQDLVRGPDGRLAYAGFLKNTSYDAVVTTLVEQGVPFCFGDGSAAACPCGNSSAPGAGAGCLNSLGGAGRVVDTGIASLTADTLVLEGSGMTNSLAIYLQGVGPLNNGLGAVLYDGLTCLALPLQRLGQKTNVLGASRFPELGNQPIHVRGQVFAPGTRAYQVYYRNAASYCTPGTANLSNGLLITWGP